MSPSQLCELLNFIKENNSWGLNMYEINHERNRKSIKYIDFCFDSRDGQIWNINCRSITGEPDKNFRIECQADLDKFYKWLNKPLHKNRGVKQ